VISSKKELPQMGKEKSGPGIFADLTEDERWVLSSKLISGASAAWRGTRDYDTSGEIHAVISDVHDPWRTGE
jgi:hypothetical protein